MNETPPFYKGRSTESCLTASYDGLDTEEISSLAIVGSKRQREDQDPDINPSPPDTPVKQTEPKRLSSKRILFSPPKFRRTASMPNLSKTSSTPCKLPKRNPANAGLGSYTHYTAIEPPMDIPPKLQLPIMDMKEFNYITPETVRNTSSLSLSDFSILLPNLSLRN
eukprot:TRINITY_DN2046_c0_g1_i1.p1 TRINITY_DN2046_c0_g1~~TRINITY_DN2046_c0_g1_i1.p1  ORF type:complete len:166 (+),score=20.08 TRINITY_DN2046_c0_g1_i1:97-594(+)